MAAQPKHKRITEARALLDYVAERLDDVRSFFKNDQTPLITGICVTEQKSDPRIVWLLGYRSAKCKPMICESFKRMLAIRLLRLQYERWLDQWVIPGQQGLGNRHSRHGLCGVFIREQRLPETSQTRGWFECGQRLLQIERGISIPGISMVLTCALSKFPHFYDSQVDQAISLLKDGYYPDIIHLAMEYTNDLSEFQMLYANIIGLKQILAIRMIQITDFINLIRDL